MIRTVGVWCCGVAADHELGETDVRVYASEEALLEAQSCAAMDPRCAPRKLTVTYDSRCFTQEEMDAGCDKL